MNQPISCGLSAQEYAARTGRTAELVRTSLRSREPVGRGQRMTFAGGDETERELRALVAAEALCCPFLRFDLARDGDELRIVVTGPDEAQPVIAQLFASGLEHDEREPARGIGAVVRVDVHPEAA